MSSFTHSSAMNYPTIRIAIAGDSGVGKSTLCKSISHDELYDELTPTNGCNTLLHNFELEGANQSFYVEVIDIGGHPNYQFCRRILYTRIDVYDVSNSKSYYNLHGWINEIEDSRKNEGCSNKVIQKWDNYWIPMNVRSRFKHSQIKQQQQKEKQSHRQLINLPVIVIGNKSDLVKEINEEFDSWKDYSLNSIIYSKNHDNDEIYKFLENVFESKYVC